MHIHTFTHILIHMHTYHIMHTHTCTHTQIGLCTHAHLDIYDHMPAHTCTHTYNTHGEAHTHVLMCPIGSASLGTVTNSPSLFPDFLSLTHKSCAITLHIYLVILIHFFIFPHWNICSMRQEVLPVVFGAAAQCLAKKRCSVSI